MHPRQPIPDALVRLALHQAGIITREQALGIGLSRHVIARLIGSAAWTPISPGIFYTAPGEPPWDALAWGGILVGGQGARVGPEASGHVAGLRPEPPLPLDIYVPPERHVMRPGPWSFLRETPEVRSAQTIGAPPRLTVEDTVLDLARTGFDGDVITLVTDAPEAPADHAQAAPCIARAPSPASPAPTPDRVAGRCRRHRVRPGTGLPARCRTGPRPSASRPSR